jgi:hypothetical protein
MNLEVDRGLSTNEDMALVKEREICIDIEQMYLLMFYTIKHLHEE